MTEALINRREQAFGKARSPLQRTRRALRDFLLCVGLYVLPASLPLSVRGQLVYRTTFSDANWVSMVRAPGTNGPINAIGVDKSGNVYVGGSFTAVGTVSASNIAQWNGSIWSSLGSGLDGPVSALDLDGSGNLYVGGAFTTAGGLDASHIAKWDGSTWSTLGSGMSGDVNALMFDNQGKLYAGGTFTTAGGESVTNIAKWDNGAWSALGLGVGDENGAVFALACDIHGHVYAGGSFTNAGGLTAANIAEWNGNAWSGLGSVLGSRLEGSIVLALACDTNGNLYAGGRFLDSVGGVTVIAQWNGGTWSVILLGACTDCNGGPGPVTALACDTNGILYASYVDNYFPIDNSASTVVSEWNGSSWTDLSFGAGGEEVYALALDTSGNLYAGGSIDYLGEVLVDKIAKWDGSVWLPLGSPGEASSDSPVAALAFDTNGNLYAGGGLGSPYQGGGQGIAKWDGLGWSNLGSFGGPDEGVNALIFDVQGNLYAGGYFSKVGGVSANSLAKWDGRAWSDLGLEFIGAGYLNRINTLVFDSSGNLYIGGWFYTPGATQPIGIARWDGHAWSTLGSGADGNVNALACDANGNLYAAGDFDHVGGVIANGFATWNSNTWSPLDWGTDSSPTALACDASGNLYAGNAEGEIAKWDGSTWSPLGLGVGDDVQDWVGTLVFDNSGNLYAGGVFTRAGGVSATNIAKWDGTAWSALGSGVDGRVFQLVCDGSGNLYAGGTFVVAGTNVSPGVAKAVLNGPTPNQILLATAGVGTNVITYLGTPGAKYALDLASSLATPVKWIPQGTNTASTANATTAGYLTFTNSNHLPQAYYRTRYVP